MERKRDRVTRQAMFVLSAGALAGVLIWSKLRLVTNIPRSAYAEPENDYSPGGLGADGQAPGVNADPGGSPDPDPLAPAAPGLDGADDAQGPTHDAVPNGTPGSGGSPPNTAGPAGRPGHQRPG